MRALYQATAVALVILFVLGAPTPTPTRPVLDWMS
jgi:hypothetical protein